MLGEAGQYERCKFMLSSIILSSLVAAGAANANLDQPKWSVYGLDHGKAVASLDTDVIMATASFADGPAIALVCSENVGLQAIYVYEPEDDLSEQVFKTQNFLRKKNGSLTMDDETYDEAWLWKRRHGTLQAKSTSTGIKILNAAFSKKDITFKFDGMDAVTLKLPKAGDDLMGFVNHCSTTQVRANDAI